MAKLTPMMEQYIELKKANSDCILFFRLGDFYEMFFEDALTASRELEITLTGRDCGMEERAPMCGVPYHSADSYIARLVEKGYDVAICEQVESPSEAKGIVKREVVRIVTSGTITDINNLDEKKNNYLSAIAISDKSIGLTYADITTGDLYSTEIKGSRDEALSKALDELARIDPSELLTNVDFESEELSILKVKFKDKIKKVDNSYFDRERSVDNILSQFNIHSISSLGLDSESSVVLSTGILLEYLKTTQKMTIDHMSNINLYSIENYMIMDINTRRNLELLQTIRGDSKKGTLLSVLDKTSTSMGARLLKKWIESPLLNPENIEQRLNVVSSLKDNNIIREELDTCLKKIYDIERLLGKLVYGNCNGRDLISLKTSVSQLPKVKEILLQSENNTLIDLVSKMDILEDVFEIIDRGIEEEPPISVKEGNIIKEDYSTELKELRDITMNGKKYLSRIESREREKTGIKNLKIKYNKVFGYFIELSKSNIDKAPDSYIRKQTLANAERYITEELKQVEDKILGSEDKMIDLEYRLFNEIREKLKAQSSKIQETAKMISKIDVFNSLSKVAFLNDYNKPEITTDGALEIIGGRHPVIEKMVEENMFISNDTNLDLRENRIMIITGPNMSGKSTYMRQVALINLLAQIGSFVPADYAKVSVADRIFTRIGASDDLSQGQSTFMVEMSEVANILSNATEKSLIVLDEIGRGTSTYDGLSIAWAVVEYISKSSNIGAKTLFATHYHELTELESKLEGIKNYRIKVEEKPGKDIVFLRKIERGGALRSYGIEVAKLAGVREEVVKRAYEILNSLEEQDLNKKSSSQISIFSNECLVKETEESNKSNVPNEKLDSAKEEVFNKLKTLDMMNMTPLEAMNTLYSLWQESVSIKE